MLVAGAAWPAAGRAYMSHVMVATIIFLVTYAVIISERLNRTVVALAGSALMIAFGVLNQEEALQAIDANTIALLVSMMIMVNVLRQTGIFRFAAGGLPSRCGVIHGG